MKNKEPEQVYIISKYFDRALLCFMLLGGIGSYMILPIYMILATK